MTQASHRFCAKYLTIAVLLLAGCSHDSSARCNPEVDLCDTGGSDNAGGASVSGGTNTASGPSTSSSGPGSGGSAQGGSSSGSGGSQGGSTGAGGAPKGDASTDAAKDSGGPIVVGPVVDASRPFRGRMVGYMPTWRGIFDPWARDLPWSKLTHLNIAFAIPSGNTFTLGVNGDESIAKLVSAAHAAGVRVLISIGGANGSDQIAALHAPGSVDNFVNALASYLDAHHFDGVDVDVEGDPVNSSYGPFIDKLVAKLRPKGQLVTSALGQWFGDRIPASAYAQFDFVNVMSYDHCGTWTAPCEQSTYDWALRDLAYFAGKGVPASKLVLGIPFYGYCWGTGCTTGTLTYLEILQRFPAATDWVQSGNVTISCNSQPTVLKKTMLARGYGGMMAWELTQDASGTQSLLNTMAGNL